MPPHCAQPGSPARSCLTDTIHFDRHVYHGRWELSPLAALRQSCCSSLYIWTLTQVVTRCSVMCMWHASYLDMPHPSVFTLSTLWLKNARVCDAGAGGSSHPVQPTNSADAAAWSALAGLYEQLSQDDIVQVIYTKDLSRSAMFALQTS